MMAMSVAQSEVLACVVASVLIPDTAERYLASARLSLSSAKAQSAPTVFFKADDAVRRGAAVLGPKRRTKRIDSLERLSARYDFLTAERKRDVSGMAGALLKKLK